MNDINKKISLEDTKISIEDAKTLEVGELLAKYIDNKTSDDLNKVIEKKLSTNEIYQEKYKSLMKTNELMNMVGETGLMVRIPERIKDLIKQSHAQSSTSESDSFFGKIKEWFRIQGPGGFLINLAQAAVAGVVLVFGVFIGRFQVPTPEVFSVQGANYEVKEYIVDSPGSTTDKLVFRGIPKAATQEIEELEQVKKNLREDFEDQVYYMRDSPGSTLDKLVFRGIPKADTQEEMQEEMINRKIEDLKREEIIREASEDLDFALSGVIEEILEERRVSSTVVIGESKFAIKLIGSFKNSNGELCDNGEINGDGYENQLFVGCQSNGSWFVSFVR